MIIIIYYYCIDINIESKNGMKNIEIAEPKHPTIDINNFMPYQTLLKSNRYIAMSLYNAINHTCTPHTYMYST